MGQQIYVSLKLGHNLELRCNPELKYALEKKLSKELIKITEEKSKESSVGKSIITIHNTILPFFYDFNKLEGSIEYNDTIYPFKIIIP